MKLAATTGPVSAATAFLPPSAPDEEVSFSSGGEVFDACEIVEHTFRASTTELIFIVENEGGDSLDAGILRQWKANSDALRSSDELSDELPTDFDDDLGLTISTRSRRRWKLRGGDVRGLHSDEVRQALAVGSLRTGQRPASETSSLIRLKYAPHRESREIKFWS